MLNARQGRDEVVVRYTVHLGGETAESADVLTHDGDGKLVAFDTAVRRDGGQSGVCQVGGMPDLASVRECPLMRTTR